MNKAELVSAVAERIGESKSRTEVILNGIFGQDGVLLERLANGEPVRISGFGVFDTKKRGPRTARNPKTNEKVEVPSKTVPIFKFSATAKGLFVD